MPDQPHTQYARESDVRIAYQVVGDGPIDLVFATGGQFPIDLIWDEPSAARFLRRLASFSRMVLLDGRGWSASRTDAETTTPTVEGWADDLRLVMDTVGMERAAVMGWFSGAFFSMFYAAAHPERVSSLLLLDGFARFLRDTDYPAGMTSDALDIGTAAYVESYGSGGDLNLFAPSALQDARFREWWARCERLANTPEGAARYWRNLAGRDIRSVLPALRMPTLVLHRRGDVFCRVEHSRYLAEHITNASIVEFDGGDHLFFTGDTDDLLDEIEVFLTGVSATHDLDRTLASVLFTDIVSSTDRAAELGDRQWRHLLDQHDALATRHVEQFRGRVIKMTGDGVLATFDGPARAIRCACALRDAVGHIGIEVRAGIHTGEVERRGDDIGGIAVNLAARVESVAQPNEVLVSRTVTDLVAGSGIVFDDRGEHDLKGVPGHWQLYAVVA